MLESSKALTASNQVFTVSHFAQGLETKGKEKHIGHPAPHLPSHHNASFRKKQHRIQSLKLLQHPWKHQQALGRLSGSICHLHHTINCRLTRVVSAQTYQPKHAESLGVQVGVAFTGIAQNTLHARIKVVPQQTSF
jgi:hypothetical protein